MGTSYDLQLASWTVSSVKLPWKMLGGEVTKGILWTSRTVFLCQEIEAQIIRIVKPLAPSASSSHSDLLGFHC